MNRSIRIGYAWMWHIPKGCAISGPRPYNTVHKEELSLDAVPLPECGLGLDKMLTVFIICADYHQLMC
jgi:hypothetical protein